MATIHGTDGNDKYDPFWESGGLNGTETADFIYGYGGDDDLYGEGGDDWLDGGAGKDHMYGGAGNDIYIVNNTADVVVEDGPTDGVVEDGNTATNSGYDTVKSYVSFVLPAGVEKLQLFEDNNARDGYGNGLDNFISGNSYSNRLEGYAGKDELWGLTGDDFLYGGPGDDTLHGNGDRDRLYGGDQNDWLYGGTETDFLYGENGHDHLIGGLGADNMYGGAHNDTYEVDDAGDVVVENAGEGLDEVRSMVSHTLTANVENLTLIGSAAINGTGNSLDNHIRGNAQNNMINGGLGADRLYGEGGQDTFVFDTALGKGNVDILCDFNVTDDTIVLESAVFAALGDVGRVLSAGEFKLIRAGTNAFVDFSDRVIYNWNTGSVLYDPDGAGVRQAVEFAQIGAGQNVTHADFVVM